jgi:hypothetical protein
MSSDLRPTISPEVACAADPEALADEKRPENCSPIRRGFAAPFTNGTYQTFVPGQYPCCFDMENAATSNLVLWRNSTASRIAHGQTERDVWLTLPVLNRHTVYAAGRFRIKT